VLRLLQRDLLDRHEARAVRGPLDGLDREVLALLQSSAELRRERLDLVGPLLDRRLQRFDLELEDPLLAVDLLRQEVRLHLGLRRRDPDALPLAALDRRLELLRELVELRLEVRAHPLLVGDLLLALGPPLVLRLDQLGELPVARLARL